MKSLLSLALSCWLALAVSPAGATPHATDQTDFWYAPGEEGWTVNVAHQYDVVFLTLFVYGPNGLPTGYSGSAGLAVANDDGLFYTGELYTTTGPWFGGPFDPNLVTRRQVGTFTFNPRSITQARLTYSIDGTTVTKQIERFTFRVNNLSGSYTAALTGVQSGCGSGDGPVTIAVPLAITHNLDNTIRLVLGDANDSCVVEGVYQQAGRLGALAGNMSCAGEPAGIYSVVEIEASVSGLMGRTTQLVSANCRVDGKIGAARN